MNPIFNYYEADIKRSTPLGSVTLEYLINAIRTPKKDIRNVFEQIRIAEECKDMATKQALKSKLYSFTPCVYVNGPRKYANIQHWTGLLVLDFDHLESDVAVEFKEYLFNEYKCIITAWLSASRHGVRALVKIPVCTSVDEFKHYFAGIERHLNCYNGFDTAPKNCILPMFISYDADIMHRTDAQTWSTKHIEIVPSAVKQYIVDDKTSVIEKIIAKRINTITDTGHIILRATSYLLGGYVGANYIDYNDAISLINNLIDSQSYLSKKPDVYKQTAKQMVNKGLNFPTYLQNR
jgi:predicted transcriptional regulator